MPKKESTLVNSILFSMYAAGALAEQALTFVLTPRYEWPRRALHGMSYNTYRNSIYNLQKRGLVSSVNKDGKKFLKLTKKGELEILLAKAKLPQTGKWDGKWRVIIFDIPKAVDRHRDKFRNLLKINNFKKLQGSVYISPFQLNREALGYLKETGLDTFIRIMKVEEMDNDRDLKKKFNLI